MQLLLDAAWAACCIAYMLYGKHMAHNPADADWFAASIGAVSSATPNCVLHAAPDGDPLTLDDCKAFRQVDSLTPGHPENFATAGVEVSTGPLGQGLSNAVGLALSERHLYATFNKPGHDIIDHYTFVICGDGCLQEGVTSQALAEPLGSGQAHLPVR